SFIAAAVFNEGYSNVLRIMKALEITIGVECRAFAEKIDAQRTQAQDRRSRDSLKESRAARKQQQLQQSEWFEEAEGILYGPGIAD
ncbi:hypothetical protein X777_06186, partial [Ooceraea biroi]